MNWEIVIGISSVVIALCALVFSIWQGVQARKHNRISFRPHLTTWTYDQAAKGFLALDLLNNGLGPALIKKFEVTVDGERMSGLGIEPMQKAMQIIFPNEEYEGHYGYLGDKYSMGAKDKSRLLALQFDLKKVPTRDTVERAFDRFVLQIEYESFYGEKFIFNSQSEKLKK